MFKHRKHFDLQTPARAIWRRVLEARAAERAAYEDGVASLVNTASYLETMMHKGFATLADEDTVVNPQEGAWAAKQLHELTREDAGVERMAQLQAKLNKIVKVMREIVPARYHQAILDTLEGKETAAIPIEAEVDEEGKAEFDPADDEGLGEEDL